MNQLLEMSAEEESVINLLSRLAIENRIAIWDSVLTVITPLSFADGIAHALVYKTDRLVPTQQHIEYAKAFCQC